MHILILGQHYAPEAISGAILAKELAEGLIARGYRVTFVTGAPNYPYGKVYPGYRNALLFRETRAGVNVIRVWSWIWPSKRFWSRILNFGTFSLLALLGGLAAGKIDVVMSVTPPLPLGMAAWLISRIRGVPWLLRVEDIFPEAAVIAGMLRNRVVIRLLEWMERFFYIKAAHITVITEGFRKNLINKGVDESKLSILPVWADPDVIKPMQKENDFRRDNGLQGKFVVLYSGNLGYTSALEDVIEAAKLLQDQSEIAFVIVGEGAKKVDLQTMVQTYGLMNVHFLPYRPREAYAEMLASADLSLVTLNRESAHTSLPGKTFNIMSSGRPILAVTEDGSELADVVRNGNCGVIVPLSSPDLLAATILSLKENPDNLTTWGINGREFLKQRYSRKRCLDLHDSAFQHMVQRSAVHKANLEI